MFQTLYDKALIWAAHPRATTYMAGLSFAESTFFPVPPDVMLVPMMLARPAQIWRLAAICAAASVIGGVFGYAIGSWAFEWIEPWIEDLGYSTAFTSAIAAFERWGFWVILAAGFSPVPYKVFTIAAGVTGMPLISSSRDRLLAVAGDFSSKLLSYGWVVNLQLSDYAAGLIAWGGWLLL